MKNQHKLIDDYVRSLLSEKEKTTFELAIAKDEVLQQEVKFRKNIVNHYKFEQVKQTIEQAKLENEMEAEKETKLKTVTATIEQAKIENIESRQRRVVLYRRLTIAAMFFLMIGGGWYFHVINNKKPILLTHIKVNEKINDIGHGTVGFNSVTSLIDSRLDSLQISILGPTYITEFEYDSCEPQILHYATHGGYLAPLQNVAAPQKERIDSLVIIANKAIDEKDFKTVLNITDQLRKDEGFETDEILQNECFIYFNQKNYTKAARQVEGIQNLELQNEVRWKLSKLYLKVGEKDLAKKQLLKIQAGAYQNKAAKKLEKLN